MTSDLTRQAEQFPVEHVYRERHVLSGAKADQGDAATLADMVRADRHHHRTVAGDSEGAQGSRSWPEPISA